MRFSGELYQADAHVLVHTSAIVTFSGHWPGCLIDIWPRHQSCLVGEQLRNRASRSEPSGAIVAPVKGLAPVFPATGRRRGAAVRGFPEDAQMVVKDDHNGTPIARTSHPAFSRALAAAGRPDADPARGQDIKTVARRGRDRLL